MKYLKILSILAITVMAASCCSCRRNSSSVNLPFQETKWQLVQMEGQSFAPRGESYSIQFSADNRIAGVGDCNRLMGGYETTAEGRLTLQGVASTRMLCPDQQNETKFVNLLDSADSYSIDGNTLMLFNDGELKLVFAAQ